MMVLAPEDLIQGWREVKGKSVNSEQRSISRLRTVVENAAGWGRRRWLVMTAATVIVAGVAACTVSEVATVNESTTGAGKQNSLVIYSGRSENLVAPLIDRFEAESGIDVEVRYGGTSEMAATIIEEGENSPADVFFGQDAGALGALAKSGRLDVLSEEILQQIPSAFRSPDGRWVGVSGRARVLVYNTDRLSESDLPDSLEPLTDEKWRGRVGWAPTNGSFQSFVTALRVLEGDAAAGEWLEKMLANDVQAFPNNTAIVEAVASGEIDVGLVNHYYLYRFLAEQGPDFPARNHHLTGSDAGSIINVAGVGIVDSASNKDGATQFIEFLLSSDAQGYFASETMEYPLSLTDSETPEGLVPLSQLSTPELDLSDLDDLQGTLQLLQESGALD